MTLRPDARILPTEEEFLAWQEHPVTRFVAAAYFRAAHKQRDVWDRALNTATTPEALMRLKTELSVREDTLKAFLENSFADYVSLVEGAKPGARLYTGEPHGRRPTGQRAQRGG